METIDLLTVVRYASKTVVLLGSIAAFIISVLWAVEYWRDEF